MTRLFMDPPPTLDSAVTTVARMASAFEVGSHDLRDIRMSDVLTLVLDLRLRAETLWELQHAASVHPAPSPATPEAT